MDWSYVTGVFDGEGNGNIYLIQNNSANHTYSYWRPLMYISNTHKQLKLKVVAFFKEYDIDSRIDKKGVAIYNWKGIGLFCIYALKYSVVKKEILTLLYKACVMWLTYYKNRKAKNTIRPDKKLAELSLRISEYSQKGPKHRITLP